MNAFNKIVRSLFLMVLFFVFLTAGSARTMAATWLNSFVPYNETHTTTSNSDDAQEVYELSDGNFLVASWTDTVGPGHDLLTPTYFYNFLLQKIDTDGNVIWEYAYGGPTKSNETLKAMMETSDNGFLVAGFTDKPGTNDMLVFKLDAGGNIVWQKSFGGLGDDQATAVTEDPSGGYVIAGLSDDAAGAGSNDGILVKLDVNGDMVWENYYGGVNADLFHSVKATSDGGFIAVGQSVSYGLGGDAWVVKTNNLGDSDGSPGTWSRYIGGGNIDEFHDVIETSDNNFLAVGMTHSAAGSASLDGFAVKLTTSGTLVWQIFLDDALLNGSDAFNSIAETAAGDFVLSGNTDSWGAGSTDGWIIKIDPAGTLLWQNTYGDAFSQHINGLIISADGGLVFAGGSSTPATGKSDIWVGKTDANGAFEDIDCSTVTPSGAAVLNPGFALNDSGKVSAKIPFTYQNATHTSVPVASNTIENTSYCPSYLEISGDSHTIVGANNELTITAYDTAGNVRTGFTGPKTLTFSGLANDGVKFPTVEGTVTGIPQVINFTAGVSDSLISTLTPQIAESATLAVTDGKLACTPVNSEPSHCLSLTVGAYVKTWSEVWQTPTMDMITTVVEAPDGNYLIGSMAGPLAAVQKVDIDGVLLWETGFADASSVTMHSLDVAADGSVIVGAVSTASGNNDLVMAKLDSNGNLLWQQLFDNGGLSDDFGKILQTADGGYLVMGQSTVSAFLAPLSEVWLIRLDAAGNILWQNLYGGPSSELPLDVIENADGSLVVTAWTQSFGAPVGEFAGWVFKVDSTGVLQWSNLYDLTVNDPGLGLTPSSVFLHGITHSADAGKFVLAGHNHIVSGGSYNEALMMQIDANGLVEWVYNFGDGGPSSEKFYDLQRRGTDYIVAGNSDGFVSGDNDGLLMFIDVTTKLISLAKTYGDTSTDEFRTFDTTADGGLIMAGRTQQPAPSKTYDAWVVKTDAMGSLYDPNCNTVNDVLPMTVITVPTHKVTDVSLSTVVTPVLAPSLLSALVAQPSGLVKRSSCTAYFIITGSASMTAGTTNELTLTAYDYLGNVVAGYDGPKYLTFSGLSPIGTFSPSVEGSTFGIPGRVDFVAGASALTGATLTAYKDEIATVHASDDVITSEPHDGTPDGGLPLTVGFAALDHYGITATTPQYAYYGWPETVTAYDLFGNVAKFNSSFTATSSGHAKFHDSSAYSAVNNVYNLVNGVARIFLMDQYVETITITVSDAAAKTGTSGVINVLPPPAGNKGGGGSSPSWPVAGGSSAGGLLDPNLPPAHPFLSTADSSEPPSLSCLQQATPEHDFADLADHYAKNAISILGHTKNGDHFVVTGYPGKNGTNEFKPNQNVSRAEFLKMALVANCIPIDNVDPVTPPTRLFYDVPLDPNVWYSNFVYTAENNGIVSGYKDGNFYPEKPISRAEAVKILVNIQKLIGHDYKPGSHFVDVTENDWFFPYVSAGKENNLLVGDLNADGDSVFRPFDHISRADSALILVRIYGLRDYLSLGDSNATTYSFL